jgi:anti-sigma regulatory factor (Ser/Thr protein kinase)
LRDDLTLLVVEDTVEVRSAAAAPDPAATVARGEERIQRIRVPGRADRLKLIRMATEQAARHVTANEPWIFDLKMAVDEACQNIIRHGYGGAEDAGDIVIDYIRHNGAFVVQLMDYAPPVDPETVKSRNLADVRPGGLGVHLIKSVCDEAIFMPPPPGVGNLFKLTKRLPPKVN